MSHEFDVINPANGSVVGRVPDCAVEDARELARRAAAAFPAWKASTAYERAATLRRWFDLILAHSAELARLIAQEMGKPVTEAAGEVRYAASFVEWYAEEAKRFYGETIPSQFADKRLFALKQPVGPVYAITPWNFPAAMVTRKAAPALAAGCTVVLKPAEQSPLTALRLAELWRTAGGPPDTFEILTAQEPAGVSQVFFDDPGIRKLSFTGGTDVGILLYAKASATMKRISLELGGHAPFLVFEDADVPAAVREVCAAKFRNGGQTCVAVNRIYVHGRRHDEFVAELAVAVSRLRLGDPLDELTEIGPLVNKQGLEKVQSHVADAVAKGARVVSGGEPRDGLYYQPTVLSAVSADARMLHEETFGPVAPVLRFETDAEAIAQANSVPYGLAAYLWTRDFSRAIRVAESLDFGIVGINDGLPSSAQAPFGGVKYSGLGREGGKWGLDEYLDVKYVSARLSSG
jgi:succinate-semialdehyde dehydrogenase/glutarate-semialdehyde dehydrogenase